jgi:hypothetical protein
MPRTVLGKWREIRSKVTSNVEDRAAWETLCIATGLNSLEMIERIATEGATVDDLPATRSGREAAELLRQLEEQPPTAEEQAAWQAYCRERGWYPAGLDDLL